jgi:hypothetical protein
MAIEKLQFAPVITPRALEELAQILRERERMELAEIVSDLIPVVQKVVENFFEPISRVRNEHDFREAFETNSREFEPFRLYINMTLLQSLDAPNFLDFYSRVLLHLSDNLFRSADAKHISSQRIRSVVDSYYVTFAALLKSMMNVNRIHNPNKVEAINLAAWIRSSTHLDYGLTSLFLILEDAISTPPRPIPELLIVTAEDSLNRFADQCRLLTEATSSGRPSPSIAQPSLLRAQELEWLREKEATGSLRDLAGKWIVIEKDQLIADDPSYERARDKARSAGVARPFLIFVPQTTEPAFMGL